MKCLAGTALMLLVATAAAAQHHRDAFGASAKSISPCLKEYEKATEYEKLRIVKMPVTTPNEKARGFFSQGMTLLYAFNHEDAMRAFTKAAELDQDFAMAHWGIALAVGPNINMPMDNYCQALARKEVEKAELAAGKRKVSKMEEGFIAALKPRYTGAPTFEADYRAAMAKLKDNYRDNPDVLSLYAESIMDLSPWGHYDKEAEDLLKDAIKIDSNHIGANHYLIHAMEMGPKFKDEAVIKSVERLQKLGLDAGHLLHMPSHIFMRLGSYHEASDSNAKAVAADGNTYGKFCVKSISAPACLPLYYGHYQSHNLSFWTAALSMEGRRAEAIDDAAKTRFQAEHFVSNEAGLEHYIATEWITWVNFRQWPKLIAAQPSTASCDEGSPQKGCHLANAMFHWARGMALAATSRPADAERERTMFGAERKQISPDLSWGNNPPDRLLEIAEHLLRARVDTARGNLASAIKALQEAVRLQDDLRYDEPPPWLYSARQSLGGALIRAGRNQEAKEAFAADLADNRNPNNGRSLFGLARALENLGDPQWEEKQKLYDEAWRYADKGYKLDLADLW